MASNASHPMAHTLAPDPQAALAEADRLCAAGDFLAAVDLLTTANRHRRDAAVECRLVEVRHAAFDQLSGTPTPSPWSTSSPEMPDPGEGLPAVDVSDLSAERLRDGILRHGCLHVRGLLPPAPVAQLVEGIDHAIAAHDAHFEGGAPASDTSPWWTAFVPGSGYGVVGPRKWVRDGGGVWTIESPRNLFDFLEAAEDQGLRDLVADYLGERPALSLKKSTLRRVPLDAGGEWHQDGAFLGASIRTLNVWLCLTDCGHDAPGLEVLPRRLDHIVETGTWGTWFEWAVAPPKVEESRGDIPLVRPDFRAGDVLLFDELFLHRTYITDAMVRERYAIETWLFAPSVYPGDQIPVVW